MDDRKLIVIPAVPSSGTSALAGVLHHLGVNMGVYSLEQNITKRGYEMFEDADIAYFCSTFEDAAHPMMPKLLGTRSRFRNYVNHRLIKSFEDEVIGCKIPATLATYDPDISTLPIVTLNVDRPLEDSIISDLKRLSDRGGDDVDMHRRMVRSSDLAGNWWAKREILTQVEPELSLTFKELVTYPRKSVENIIVALQAADLGCEFLPTRKQREQAILFLDKDKKSI
jgi:hypothetical protein